MGDNNMTKPTALQVAKEIVDFYLFHENGPQYDPDVMHVCQAFIAQDAELSAAREVIESIAAEKCNPSFDEVLPTLERGKLISIIDCDTALAREWLEKWGKV